MRKVLYLLAAALSLAGIFFVLRGSAQVTDTNGVSYVPAPQPAAAGNPTACVSTTATNGSALTYTRSDAAPAICSNMSPTMTGNWAFTNPVTVGGNQVAQVLSATSSALGGSLLTVGSCSTTNVTVTGAAVGNFVWVTPTTYPGNGVFWNAFIASANTVTVNVCAVLAITPISTTYVVRVLL